MEPFILDQIPFAVDRDGLKAKLHVKEEGTYLDSLLRLTDEAERIARPKGLYRLSFIDSKGDGHVIVEGVKLKSRVLRVNLEQAQRVFPFVATCGMELEDWANGIDDMVHRYWAESIKEMALRVASQAVEDHLMATFRPGKVARMGPGSLSDWPIEQQRPLFQILGNPRDSIGVSLTESLLMIPTKSISGIRFPTEESFESCQLCPREVCSNRRAPFDPTLFDKKYRQDIR